MIDARNYSVSETLRNGLEVCIRAARPDDSDLLIEAFRKLDPESVYLRFFGPKKELSASDVKRFREADFINRVILLCTVHEDGREIVIASGTYVRSADAVAEVAFIVEEDYHRLGIARRLLTHLGKIATEAGIRTFVAEVLPQNTAMLGVFGRCGWPMATRIADGVTHITLDLN
ncbi:MAG: GNAT family N-acetyltransferase [Betaproteobacteria bacterium]|nr:GNAT family N-acetyltransferase [Betaproteobacteria bacterium]